MRRHVRTPGARDLMRLAIWAVWAAEPEDVSLLHVLFYIRSAGLVRGAARHRGRRPAGLPRRRRHAADLAAHGRAAGRRVCASSAPVRRIEHGPAGVTVHADGATVRARRAIVAMPPTLAGADLLRPAAARRSATGSPSGWRRAASSSAWRSTRSRSGAPTASPGQVTSADGPGLGHLRQLAARRIAGRPARLPRGPRGARRGGICPGASAARP